MSVWWKVWLNEWEKNRQHTLMMMEILHQLIARWRGDPFDKPVFLYHLYSLSMKIISWNFQGASNDDFRRNFRDLVLRHGPSVVFLLETRVYEEHVLEILPTLGFYNYDLASGMMGGI